MSKLLKSHAADLSEIKNQQQQGRKFDETCRVRICICTESKNRKINDDKNGNKEKKQDS